MWFRYFLLERVPLLDFICVLILGSMDFWVCKNIIGKKLACLRWWIEFDQVTQTEEWVFESADPNIKPHQINYLVFWVCKFLFFGFWLINFLIVLIFGDQLFWFGLSFFCFLLSLINLACFYKCRGAHQKKIKEIMESIGLRISAYNINQS